jgi:hypothetical protein
VTTTRVPSLVVIDATVTNDPAARRLGETASGYQRLQFRETWRRLLLAEQSGWRSPDPTVWASARVVTGLLSLFLILIGQCCGSIFRSAMVAFTRRWSADPG